MSRSAPALNVLACQETDNMGDFLLTFSVLFSFSLFFLLFAIKVKAMENGTVVSDCHAEVLSRRAFLKFLMECVARGEEHVVKGATFYPKIHFYSSALPCGDCSIIPMALSDDSAVPEVKRPKLTSGLLDDFKSERSADRHLSDIYRTGARPVVTGSDPQLPGELFHTIGIGL